MKIVSGRDFIIGALTATMFFMLLGAGLNEDEKEDVNVTGRFIPAATATGICVTDTYSGSTTCTDGRMHEIMDPKYFKPKFK